MKIVIFADGVIGLGALQYVLTHYPQDIALVIVNGEGPVQELAMLHKVSCEEWRDSSHLCKRLREEPELDLGILAWWPKLIKSDLLAIPKQGFINFHPSLLPYNRGKHYNFWAIVESAPFGVSIHKVDAGIDSGPILFQRSISYSWQDTGGSLYDKAQQAMLELFIASYPQIRTGQYTERVQDNAIGSLHYAKELDAASQINLEARYTARDLLNLLRARTFTGKPACWFADAGKIWEVRVQICEKNDNTPTEVGKENA